MNSVKQHYENLLANHYSWMFGDFDQQVEENINRFKKHEILPKSNKKAIDLGCGSGFQSFALAELGFNVTAVDFSRSLLDELRSRDKKGAIEIIQSDMMNPENYSYKAPFELTVCMGDTLSHLSSDQSLYDFFQIAFDVTEPGGTLILSFRDYSVELTGTDRFIPVQNDPDKLMTVFLEYESKYVLVHDLLYQRNGKSWEFEKSVYKKIRLSADQVKSHLENINFSIKHIRSEQGFIHIIAAKS